MVQTETKILTAHIPLPLAEKIDQIATRFEFEPREIRRIIVGKYEVRYEIQEYTLYTAPPRQHNQDHDARKIKFSAMQQITKWLTIRFCSYGNHI